jgi:dihydroorotase (multifunctional complex type)
MKTIDLVLRNGFLVTPAGVVQGDLAIENGKIVGITSGDFSPDGRETVDLNGMIVLPGGVDTHTHLREPGYTNKEDITTGTQAAAAGGYTTVMGMPNVKPVTTTVERYREIIEIYKRKSVVDFNHHPACTNIRELQGLVDAGALALKLFMISDRGTDYPHMPELGVHHQGQILEIAEAITPTGVPFMVHPNNQDVLDTLADRAISRGDTSYQTYAKMPSTYDGFTFDTAISFLVRLQEVTGVRLHLLHLRSPRSLDILKRAKLAGRQVTAETNPQMMFLCNDWDSIERLGPYSLNYWNGPDTTDMLWEALREGTIDIIGTDHAPHTREEKEIGWTDMYKAPNGTPKIQETLSLFLTEVHQGRISLGRLAEIFSTTPAKLFGIYPQKGVIQIGSDADLVIADFDKKTTIRNNDMLSRCGWSSWDGREVHGFPIHTLVRGVFVMRDGKVMGAPGYGKMVTRPR